MGMMAASTCHQEVAGERGGGGRPSLPEPTGPGTGDTFLRSLGKMAFRRGGGLSTE